MTAEDKKTERVTLTLSKTEKEFLRNMSTTVGMSISEIVRAVLIYQVVDLPKPDYIRQVKVSDEGRRTANIYVQVTDDEKSTLKSKAESLGCTLSDYVRRAAIHGETRVMDVNLQPIEKANHELLKQGTNLNQLMYYVNRTKGKDFNPKEVAAVLKKVRKAVDKTDDAVTQIMSDYHQKKDTQ